MTVLERDILNILDVLYSDPTARFEDLIRDVGTAEEKEKDEFDQFFDLSEIKL